MRRLSNFLCFYAGWLACVLGAAQGQLWSGPVTVLALLVLQLLWSDDARGEARLIAIAGVLGWTVDTALASAGIFSFGAHSVLPWICPPWMVALWLIFASTLRGALSWLAGRYVLAAVLGAVGGPLSYLCGARLGAIELGNPMSSCLVVIGVVWSLTLPALLWVADESRSQVEIDTDEIEPAAAA